MKKSLVALAALAAVGGAFAQSSVTLFGVVDATIKHTRGAGNGSNNELSNSGLSSSRLGFRGVEDLGGGLSAGFHLEGAIANDDGRAGGSVAAGNQARTEAAFGGLNFNRRSTLSLSGGFGEVRLGRDLTPSFVSWSQYDPFGTVGVGSATNTVLGLSLPLGSSAGVLAGTAARASNGISYITPGNLGGFVGQFTYAFGENGSVPAATKNDGRHIGLRVGYGAGPVSVSLGYGSTKLSALDKYRTINLGASWDFGVAKATALISREEAGIGAANQENRSWLLGAIVPVGAGEIHASYSRARIDQVGADPRGTQIAVGYVHNLSKRTAVYTTYARISNKNGGQAFFSNGRAATTVNGSTSGLDLGIRHAF